MTLFAPIGNDRYHLFWVLADVWVKSLHAEKSRALRLARMPVGHSDGAVPKVRHKPLLHFLIAIRAISRFHLGIPVDLMDVIERTGIQRRRPRQLTQLFCLGLTLEGAESRGGVTE